MYEITQHNTTHSTQHTHTHYRCVSIRKYTIRKYKLPLNIIIAPKAEGQGWYCCAEYSSANWQWAWDEYICLSNGSLSFQIIIISVCKESFDMNYLSLTPLQFKSREISFVHNVFFSCSIIALWRFAQGTAVIIPSSLKVSKRFANWNGCYW